MPTRTGIFSTLFLGRAQQPAPLLRLHHHQVVRVETAVNVVAGMEVLSPGAGMAGGRQELGEAGTGAIVVCIGTASPPQEGAALHPLDWLGA